MGMLKVIIFVLISGKEGSDYYLPPEPTTQRSGTPRQGAYKSNCSSGGGCVRSEWLSKPEGPRYGMCRVFNIKC